MVILVEVRALPCENVGLERFSCRNSQRLLILGVLREYNVPLCDRAISFAVGLPVNIVTARRAELFHDGLVFFGFKAKSPYSNVRVKHWGAKQ